jgi:ADP-ribose pyrophosphatase YjhB (NUDIX family)
MEINRKYVYLEHDGKILLVDKNGDGPMLPKMGRMEIQNVENLLRLPTLEEVKKMEINWTLLRTNNITLGKRIFTILLGEPDINWPENWAWKDSVISDNSVNPVVRECVYRTIHRIVSKVIMINDDKILMAKVSRGFFKGQWTLPGGFVNYDEHPRKGAEREVLEELGVEITIPDSKGESGKIRKGDDGLFIQHEIFNEEGISWVSFTYKCNTNRDIRDFKLKEDEIEEVKWFSINDAKRNSASPFDINAINALIEEK